MIKLEITTSLILVDVKTLLHEVNKNLLEIKKSENDNIENIIKKYNDSLKIVNRVKKIFEKDDKDYLGKIKVFYNRVSEQIDSKINKEFNEETLTNMAIECNVLRENYFDYDKNKNSFKEWPRVTEQEYNRKKLEDYRKLQEEKNKKATVINAIDKPAARRGGSKKNKRNKKHKTLRKKNTRSRTRRQKRH